MPSDESPVTIRAAAADDVETLAMIWYDGWRDAHLEHAGEELLALRTPETFRSRMAARIPDTAVAEVGHGIAGFVTVIDDEVEQLYVDARHRGTGVAALLLRQGERVIAERGHRQAWLAVIPENDRARRFYARQGWVDEGVFQYRAEGSAGPIDVPCHRYAKRLEEAGSG